MVFLLLKQYYKLPDTNQVAEGKLSFRSGLTGDCFAFFIALTDVWDRVRTSSTVLLILHIFMCLELSIGVQVCSLCGYVK